MTAKAYRRLAESQPLQQSQASMEGLWRTEHLRAPEGRDRRRDVRIPTDDDALLTTLDAPDNPIDIRVMDVSRGGLGITSLLYLPAGALVRVQLRALAVFCEVRHSHMANGGFQSGLQIQAVVVRQ